MLFEDGYVLNQGFGDHGFGLDGLFGPSRFDTGEIVVVGRVPGAVYFDDLTPGQTFLEHVLDSVTAETSLGDASSNQDFFSPELSSAATSDVQTDSAQGLILSGLGKDAQPIYGDGPAMSGEEGFTALIGGRPYESLSFLIIDTPFAYGDSHLTASLRPSVDTLLGLADDGVDGWVLPTAGRGAWRLS